MKLGHPFDKILQLLVSDHLDIFSPSIITCDACAFAKQKCLKYFSSTSKSLQFFELIHVDIWGPIFVSSIDGYKYFFTIVDDYSRFTWILFLKNKTEVRSLLQDFIILTENQFSCKLKKIRSDNGKEFLLNDFYNNKGIFHETSCVATPQQNGIVERKHQHLLNVCRALLFQAKIPNILWSYSLKLVVHLINRLPTPFLSNQSPYELVYSTKPEFSNLKVFGCLAYASSANTGRTKLDSRSLKCVFLGYKSGTKGYVLYDLHSKSINVIFHENIFPYSFSLPSDNSIASIDDSHNCDISMYAFPALPVSHATDLTTDPVTSIVYNNAEVTDLDLRTSHRVKNRPRYLDQYYCGAASTSCSTFSTHYPMRSFISYDNCSSDHTAFFHNISAQAKPFSFKEAAQHDCWKQAMDAELHALDKNQTWTIVPPPSDIKPIGCRWVYKLKHKPDDTVDSFKARLVAKGFTQTERIDYFETFSPVVKLTTVRILLALASASDWFIHQLDVDNAFLHGDLHEEIYMKPPPGLSLPQPNLVCKLNKSLYGLKQACRNWNQKLTSELLLLG